MKVVIKGKEYDYSFDSVWGPLYTYEELFSDKVPFDIRKTLCIHLMMYCILLRSNTGFDLSIDDFIKALDDMKLESEMRSHYFERMKLLTSGSSEESENADDAKKKD